MREGRFLSSSLREFFAREKYQDFLLFLLESFEKCLIYYFDVPFQTTIERHRTRPQRAFFPNHRYKSGGSKKDLLFGENGIASKSNDTSNKSVLSKEKMFTEKQTISEMITMILEDTKQFQK